MLVFFLASTQKKAFCLPSALAFFLLFPKMAEKISVGEWKMQMDHALRTVNGPVRVSGVGLHSGVPVDLAILPAQADTGILFVRTDLPDRPVIPACVDTIIDTSYATTIGTPSGTVSTIEHLMGAFCGLGIDSAIVEISGPEVPAMDGSAYPFVALISRQGLRSLGGGRRWLEILEPIEVRSGDKYLRVEPYPGFSIRYEIDFDHPLVARQQFDDFITQDNFESTICRARTFGFLKEVEWMRDHGLALGGSLENAIVMNDTAVLNEGGLRFPDEFVHHKVLDMMGDLYLLGMPIRGKVSAYKSGHALHHLLLRKILDTPGSWRLTSAPPVWDYPPCPITQEAFTFAHTS